jgi:hypothetical protein
MIPSASLPPGRYDVFLEDISITSALAKRAGPMQRGKTQSNSFFIWKSGFGL